MSILAFSMETQHAPVGRVCVFLSGLVSMLTGWCIKSVKDAAFLFLDKALINILAAECVCELLIMEVLIMKFGTPGNRTL